MGAKSGGWTEWKLADGRPLSALRNDGDVPAPPENE